MEKEQYLQFRETLRTMLREAKDYDEEGFASSVQLALDVIAEWCNPPTSYLRRTAPKALMHIQRLWDLAMMKIITFPKIDKKHKMLLLQIIVKSIRRRYKKDHLDVFFTKLQHPHSLSSGVRYLLHRMDEVRKHGPRFFFTTRQETFLQQLKDMLDKKINTLPSVTIVARQETTTKTPSPNPVASRRSRISSTRMPTIRAM